MSSKISYNNSKIRNHVLKNRELSHLHQAGALLTIITALQSTLSKDQSLQAIQFQLETAVSHPTPILSHKGTTQEGRAFSTIQP